ncbi:hypothetical protein OC845_002782 [Tilletia horrida]|nr:hypothetical protein OC845_002782 [Tilletia horrida]
MSRFPLACIASRHPHALANLIVVSVAATTILQSLVNGALTVAVPSIALDLGVTTDMLQWPIAVLSLSNGALLLIAGAIADSIVGRRSMFLAGLAVFAIAAVGTAFVRNGIQLSALCACIGCAAAMLSPAGVGILAACLPDQGQYKSRAFAALGAGQPIGFIVGLLLGGILSTGGRWRFIFWIAAGIAFLFLILCIAVLPRDDTVIVFGGKVHHHHHSRRHPPTDSEAESGRHLTSGAATPAHTSTTELSTHLERTTTLVSIASDASQPTLAQALWHFDWIGALLSTSGLTLLTFALADAETGRGWKKPYIPALLPLSAFAISSFVLWERRLERAALLKRQRGESGLTFEPLLPPSVWRAPRFGILLTIIFAAWLSFNCLSYFITVMIQVVQKVSPLQTSLRFIPMIISGIMINILSGWLIPKIKPMWVISVGTTAGAAAAILYALISPDLSYFKGMFFVLILVVGPDFAFPVAQIYSVRSVGRHHAALAGSLFATTVRVASSVGLALTSTISTAVARAYASSHSIDATDPQALLRGYRAAGWTCAAFSIFAVALAFVSLRDIGPLKGDESEIGVLDGGEKDEGKLNGSAAVGSGDVEQQQQQHLGGGEEGRAEVGRSRSIVIATGVGPLPATGVVESVELHRLSMDKRPNAEGAADSRDKRASFPSNALRS